MAPTSKPAIKMNPGDEDEISPAEMLGPPWREMDEAPRDMITKVVLTDGAGIQQPALWFKTRRRVHMKWVPFEGWIDPLSRNPIAFEPVAWRINEAWA